ncbi:MAG: GmrSD restriction endonuclease domain-containing protein [Streptosporangiaceae bacterium]
MRDLLDSMYKGFPVGYLLFWETGADAGARQIGVEEKQKAPRLLIVDGQQRLTSLYAVITGSEIVKDDYSGERIRIAFRPSDAMFAVADAATDKDPEFIADISALWVPSQRKQVVRDYLKRLEGKREMADAERDRLEEAVDRLHDLRDYPFKAVELASSVEEEQVAEVFVRRSTPRASP